jgi:hypothetical protein
VASSSVTASNSSVASAGAQVVAAVSAGSEQVRSMSGLPSQTLSIPTGNANAQQVQPVPTSGPPISQSLATNSSLGQDLAPESRTSQAVFADQPQPQPIGGIDYVEPAPDAAQGPSPPPKPAAAPLPQGVPAQAPAGLGRPSLEPALDDFDEALAHLAESSVTGRLGPSRAEPPGPGHARRTPPVFGVSTLVGTAALTAGGYWLVLRQPDERRRPTFFQSRPLPH